MTIRSIAWLLRSMSGAASRSSVDNVVLSSRYAALGRIAARGPLEIVHDQGRQLCLLLLEADEGLVLQAKRVLAMLELHHPQLEIEKRHALSAQGS